MKKYYPIEMAAGRNPDTNPETIRLFLSFIKEVSGDNRTPDMCSVLQSRRVMNSIIATLGYKETSATIDPKLLPTVIKEYLQTPAFVALIHLYRWIKCGRRIYEVSPDLAQVFQNTEMNFGAEDIITPCPEFYISVSGVQDRVTKYEATANSPEYVTEEKVTGFFVGEDLFGFPSELKPELMTFGPGVEAEVVVKEVPCYINDKVTEIIPVNLFESYRNSLSMTAICLDQQNKEFPGGLLMIPREMKGLTVEEYRAQQKILTKAIVEPVSSSYTSNHSSKWNRFVLNFLYYLNSVEPDIVYRPYAPQSVLNRAAKKSGKAGSRLIHKHSLGQRIIYVGENLCDRMKHESPSAHWRRAHWWWCPCGEGHKGRKLQMRKGSWVNRDGQDSESTTVTIVD